MFGRVWKVLQNKFSNSFPTFFQHGPFFCRTFPTRPSTCVFPIDFNGVGKLLENCWKKVFQQFSNSFPTRHLFLQNFPTVFHHVQVEGAGRQRGILPRRTCISRKNHSQAGVSTSLPLSLSLSRCLLFSFAFFPFWMGMLFTRSCKIVFKRLEKLGEKYGPSKGSVPPHPRQVLPPAPSAPAPKQGDVNQQDALGRYSGFTSDNKQWKFWQAQSGDQEATVFANQHFPSACGFPVDWNTGWDMANPKHALALYEAPERHSPWWVLFTPRTWPERWSTRCDEELLQGPGDERIYDDPGARSATG